MLKCIVRMYICMTVAESACLTGLMNNQKLSSPNSAICYPRRHLCIYMQYLSYICQEFGCFLLTGEHRNRRSTESSVVSEKVSLSLNLTHQACQLA